MQSKKGQKGKGRHARSYASYEQWRKGDGPRYLLGLAAVMAIARELGPRAGMNPRDISIFGCLVDMARRGLSYREYHTFLVVSPGMLGEFGLGSAPGKSCLHAAAKRWSRRTRILDRILLEQAGDGAYGTLVGDSTGFAITAYARWLHARYGRILRRGFVKAHTIMCRNRKIAACTVTRGTGGDAPAFLKMLARIPKGVGYVILDKAYDTKAIHEAVRRIGRKALVPPRRGFSARGNGARAKAIREYLADVEAFYAIYHERSRVESSYSSMKERTDDKVRATTFPMQRLALMLRCVAYNLYA